jgi:hypothetical protein
MAGRMDVLYLTLSAFDLLPEKYVVTLMHIINSFFLSAHNRQLVQRSSRQQQQQQQQQQQRSNNKH